LQNNSDIDLSPLLGFSISTSKLSQSGVRLINRIHFTNKFKQSYRLEIETTDSIVNIVSDIDQAQKFKLAIEESSDKEILSLADYTHDLIGVFRAAQVWGIESKLHLGEFVEVFFDAKCSCWYKQDGVSLNKNYIVYFNEADTLKQDYYMLKYRNLSPVLNEHPPNFQKWCMGDHINYARLTRSLKAIIAARAFTQSLSKLIVPFECLRLRSYML